MKGYVRLISGAEKALRGCDAKCTEQKHSAACRMRKYRRLQKQFTHPTLGVGQRKGTRLTEGYNGVADVQFDYGVAAKAPAPISVMLGKVEHVVAPRSRVRRKLTLAQRLERREARAKAWVRQRRIDRLMADILFEEVRRK